MLWRMLQAASNKQPASLFKVLILQRCASKWYVAHARQRSSKKGEPGMLCWPEGELVIADDATRRSEWGEQERLNAVQKVQTEVGLSIKPEDLTYVGRETRNSRSDEEATATDCWMYVMPNHLKEAKSLPKIFTTDYTTELDDVSTQSEVREGVWVELEEWTREAQG